MPCVNSSHAQHILLRGCCKSTCPCSSDVSYSAELYCPCNDTVAKNFTRTYGEQVCYILSGISGTQIGSTRTSLNNLDWSSIKCGTYHIYTNIPVPDRLIGTVIGASSGGTINFDGADDITEPGIFNIYIGSETQPICAIVTIPT